MSAEHMRSAPPGGSWDGRLVLAPGRLLLTGPAGAAGRHAHHALQFVWGLERELTLELGDRRIHRRSTVLAANTPHAFDGLGQPLVLLLLDGLGTAARALAGLESGAELASRLEGLSPPSISDDVATLGRWPDRLLARLGVDARPSAGLSGATVRALRFIERGLDGVPRLDAAAAAAKLSPDRLSHLFGAEVGLPFRRYVLWARLQRAVEVAGRGGSLTECAAAAGFSDGAHFSRTFRANFGLAPSMVLPRIELDADAWRRS